MRRFLVSLVLLTGCDLYFGGQGDDEPPCKDIAWGVGAPAIELRNPETGECQTFSGGWECPPDSCGPCPYGGDAIAIPDWPQCNSMCEYLDETTCLTTPGCQAAYDEDVSWADAPSKTTFKGCWATTTTGPVPGSCWNLDAEQCAHNDTCSPFYGMDAGTTFSRCAPEPTNNGCAAVDCGPGYHCEEQCYPCDGVDGPCDMPYCTPACVPDDPGYTCAAVDCGPGYECVEVCDAPAMTEGGCIPPGQCYPQCVPVGGGNPGSCTGEVLCDALPPACPANTTPGRANGCWTGYCIPNSACGPSDPGSCTGTVTCLAPQPACPSGTTPGIANGCWTGYCIPDHHCGPSACELITDEMACAARFDCNPVYTGGNCTCTPGGGCTCEDLTFDRCETWGPMPF